MDAGEESEAAARPQLQVYYVTVEWLDDLHRPESTERLAQAIRSLIEHGHNVTPETPPARFTVRVKSGDVAAEVSGTVQHHHHQHG